MFERKSIQSSDVPQACLRSIPLILCLIVSLCVWSPLAVADEEDWSACLEEAKRAYQECLEEREPRNASKLARCEYDCFDQQSGVRSCLLKCADDALGRSGDSFCAGLYYGTRDQCLRQRI